MNKKGFTLMELIRVLLILAIIVLVFVVLPILSKNLWNNQVVDGLLKSAKPVESAMLFFKMMMWGLLPSIVGALIVTLFFIYLKLDEVGSAALILIIGIIGVVFVMIAVKMHLWNNYVVTSLLSSAHPIESKWTAFLLSITGGCGGVLPVFAYPLFKSTSKKEK